MKHCVLFSGYCENDPSFDMIENILESAGVLPINIVNFIEKECHTKCTERGIGIGYWDVGFIHTDMEHTHKTIERVIDKFKKAWDSNLFSVTISMNK